MQREEAAALQQKLATLQAEQAQIAAQIEAQKQRLAMAEETSARFGELRRQGFVSRLQAQEKEDAVLEHQTRLQSLLRERIGVERQRQDAQNELANLPLKQQMQVAQIERGLSSTGQEWVESEGRRRLAITAPQSGVVTALTVEPGQSADTAKPLLAIVPDGATLEAQLFAPSRAIGFVKEGDAVHLRYQAYPYQKFGHQLGRVVSVSKVAMGPPELSALLGTSGTASGNEPMYRIAVALASQSVTAYGDPRPLQPGMALDADIVQETRRLYEWVLEPLYTLGGKL